MKPLDEIIKENKEADKPTDKSITIQLWKEVNELLDAGDESVIANELFELKRELYLLKHMR